MWANLLIAAPLVIAAIFGVWLVRWQFRCSDQMLETWAREQGYTILKKQRANIGDGPMGTRQASRAVKYRVALTDQAGQTRRALVTLGSRSSGILAQEIAVEWLK